MLRKLLAISLFTAFLLSAAGNGVLHAQTREIEQHRNNISRLEQDISFLDKQIRSTQAKKKSTLEELVFIQKKVSSRKKLLEEIDLEIRQQQRDISAKEKQIRIMEQRLDTLEHYHRRMIMNAYKHRDTKVWFMYILASANMEQGYRRWSYLKNYSRSINAQAEKIRETRDDLEKEKRGLIALKDRNAQIRSAREKEYLSLTAEEKQSRNFARTLDRRQSQYRSQLAQKRREADRLAREVQRLIALELQKQKAEVKKEEKQQPQVQQQAVQLSGSFAANKGRLPFPVASGVIIEQFGEHPHPTLKNVKLPFNNGINISTTAGNSVTAVFDGVIKQVIAIPGYNQCVLMQHGQYFTFYCKLGQVGVKVGDKVKTGTVLGTLAVSNNTSTLHFELWNGTVKQNPELWLKKR